MTPKHPWLGLLAFLVLCFAAAGIGGAVPWREVWPFVEPWQFGADHLRVGPDIPLRNATRRPARSRPSLDTTAGRSPTPGSHRGMPVITRSTS